MSGAILVLLVSALAAAGFVLSPGNQAAASFIGPQPGSIPWNGKDRLNVLFLGLNARKSAATSLAVASYDTRSRTVRLLSIPASLWVSIPGFGQDKIANAYADGGTRLALLTAESVTRTVIPYYVALDPATVRRLVDSYGGLSVPRAAGRPAHLDGAAALRYMGAGPVGRDGESQRMQRDAVIASAVKAAAVQPTNMLQMVSLINTLGADIHTNFPYNQIPPLVQQLKFAAIEPTALDESRADVTQYRSSSGPVLLPDWQRITSTVRELFPPSGLRSGKVKVLNGSGVLGQAQSLASWLRGMGIRVAGFGSADSFSYSHTLVVVNTASRTRDTALARSLSAVLQAPVVTRSVHGSRAPVVVIIGRDYQDLTQQ
jgi:anionic cell wall polymer biosynthesis LytR-Cps2A-Psr (LCP) family protein